MRAVFPNSRQAAGSRPVRHRRAAVGGAEPALLVPQAAVQEDQGGRFVLVVGADNKAEVRRIETGARVGMLWEVTSGLAEGERVIYEGLQKVQPGVAVTPTTERPPPAPAG